MAKVYPFLNTQYRSKEDKNKPENDCSFPIVIYLYAGKRKLHPTGYSSKLKDWDEVAGRVKKTHPEHAIINPTIEGLMAKANAYKSKCEIERTAFNVNHVFEEIVKDSSFLSFLRNEAKVRHTAGRHHTASNYEVCANLLEDYAKGDVTFTDVTEKFVAGFDTFLRERKNGVKTRKLRFNTLAKNYGVAVNKGIAPQANYFELYEILDRETVKLKETLTAEEIKRIEELKFNPNRWKLRIARDMYLFSLYCKGMRFVNLLFIDKKKDIRNGRIFWQPAKQSPTLMSAKITPKLQELIDKNKYNHSRYLFCFKDWKVETELDKFTVETSVNHRFNDRLRQIAKKANIDKHLSFHTARHTFASNVFRKTKNLSVTQEFIGHDDIRSTKKYVRELGFDFMDEIADIVCDYSETGKVVNLNAVKDENREAI